MYGEQLNTRHNRHQESKLFIAKGCSFSIFTNHMTSEKNAALPVAMTIAGSDSGAGAGIQADLLTFAAHGVFGTTAITCLTAQNPDGVTGIHASSAEIVTKQIKQVHDYFKPKALKTGMLLNKEIIQVVARFLQDHPETLSVVDPVMVATSGARLLEEDAIDCLKNDLLPHATLITPNLDEAEVLIGWKPTSAIEMEKAAKELQESLGVNVLLKGGHMDRNALVDVFANKLGQVLQIEHERIHGVNTHGSGCTLSAAIAANMALGNSIAASVYKALDYVFDSMNHALKPAHERFMNHFPYKC